MNQLLEKLFSLGTQKTGGVWRFELDGKNIIEIGDGNFRFFDSKGIVWVEGTYDQEGWKLGQGECLSDDEVMARLIPLFR